VHQRPQRVHLIPSPAAQERPGEAAAAIALGRVLDGRAQTTKPGAAKVLAGLLDSLRAASARDRRGGLASVRAMTTTEGGA